MRISQFPRIAMLAATLMFAAAPAVQASEPKPVSKWRIEFNHTTDNDGAVTFRIAPDGGQPIDVETKIPKGTGENHAARIVKDSLKASLGDAYHVEVDDGEDVLVKRRGKTPKFIVTMVSTSLTGLTIEVEKD